MATRIKRIIGAALVALLTACGSAPVGPGFYRVQRGDTVSGIARENRQSVHSIARWNHLADPNAIDVGQVLRVAPPGGTSTAGTAMTRRSRPPEARSRPAPEAPAEAAAKPAAPIALVWPARGTVIRPFNGRDSKGIDIADAAGTPIVAAAAGRVVYAGNGLRGYGNLLIIKHRDGYLTAYAHNEALLVKEDQEVSQGQEIARMGSTDNDRVMLHFELRYEGRSIDPARALPPR